jgi:SAM-dependent methyltransferase
VIIHLKTRYYREMFLPGWLGVIVNPFYFARSGLAAAINELSLSLSGRLLDVGCGSKPYRSLFKIEEYVGLDIENDLTRGRGVAEYLYDGTIFPFPDASFDSVLCNQVLEHVFNPNEFLDEIVRVMKPDAKLLLTVPFVWDEHEQPLDYARYSSFGLRTLLEKHGLRVAVHRKLGADISVLFQLSNAYLYKVIQDLPGPVKLFLTVTLMASINLIGLLARWLLPENPDLFLDHCVLAEKTV